MELPLESASNFIVFALFVGLVIGIPIGAVAQSLLRRLLIRSEPKTQGEKPGYGNSTGSNNPAA